jgi:ribonuclease HII
MPPSLDLEKSFFTKGKKLIAGLDEVGRGCLAGPVSIGICLINPETSAPPSKLNDSKLLSPKVRNEMVPLLQTWASAYSVGHSTNNEIDSYGLSTALRLAAARAFNQLSIKPELIIIDGKYNWLRPPSAAIVNQLPNQIKTELELLDQQIEHITVIAKVKADQSCACVSAASVLAKVERDELITQLSKNYQDYGWDKNKGYASPEHLAAINRLGATEHHRISWKPFI